MERTLEQSNKSQKKTENLIDSNRFRAYELRHIMKGEFKENFKDVTYFGQQKHLQILV
jgi:hypothetical protein